MKLSKSLIATVLVLCMLLSVMPVFGATVSMPITEINVPAEGLEIKASAMGVNGSHWKIVVSNTYTSKMGISHDYTKETWVNSNNALTGSSYDGLVLSGKTKISNSDFASAITGAVCEFTFTNVPISRVSYRPSNAMSFCLSYADLASGKYISDVKVKDAEGNIVDYDGALTVTNFKYNGSSYTAFTAPTEFRVDRGTWDGFATIDTGVFPENTIFINAYNLEKTDLATTNEDTHGGILIRRDGKGEFGVFVPKASGSYYVYALRHHHSSGDSDRTSKITVVTTDIVDNAVAEVSKNYVFSGSVGASTATGHSLFWCAPAGGGATTLVDLKEGEPFLIRRNKGGGYDRLAGIAFVPAKADGTNPMSDVADATWTYTNLPTSNEQINMWQNSTVTTVDLSDSVTVTVNGVETVVPAMAARKIGYDAEDGVLTWIKKINMAGDMITAPTVFDALVTATSPVEGNEDGYMPYDTVNDGFATGYCPPEYSITLNGKLALRPAMIEIKDGDVIETVANNPSNFRPVAMSTQANSSTTSLVEQFNIASVANNVFQYGMRLSRFNALGYVATEEGNNAEEFNNCLVSGYMYPRYTAATHNRWGAVVPDSNSTFYSDSKVYFDLKIAYRGSTNSSGLPFYYPVEGERNEYKIINNKDGALITVGDKLLHHPYIIADTSNVTYDYYGENLFLCNKQTDTGLKVNKSAYTNRITLTTEATKLFTLTIVTYAEDGKTILNTRMLKDQYVTWERGYSFTLNENQKAFVWGAKAYEGTNMKAICEPITID